MAEQRIETGSPYFIPMNVAFTGVEDEPVRAETPANNNIDVRITSGLTDLKQALVQFSLPTGRVPALWSTEKIPILSLLDYLDEAPGAAPWSKPFTLRKSRQIEGQFTNAGAEPAGKIVFVCEQVTSVITEVRADLPNVGEMLNVGIDSQFTNTASEEPSRAYSAPMNWDFIVYGFYSELARADIKITDIDGKEWMGGWTPIWAVGGRQDMAIKRRLLRRPYLIPSQRSLGVNFKNDADVPETSGKLWMFGQRLS